MSGLRTNADNQNMLCEVRTQRLKSIAFLPSLITILNGICGFFSIIFTSRNDFSMAGFMIFIVMFADILDVRLARMSRNISSYLLRFRIKQLNEMDILPIRNPALFSVWQNLEQKDKQLKSHPELH